MAQVDRIDVLVNNAGQIHASVVEETRLEEAKDILETNFWGAVRVTEAGLVGIPGQGFYSASKFALEGYTEAL